MRKQHACIILPVERSSVHCQSINTPTVPAQHPHSTKAKSCSVESTNKVSFATSLARSDNLRIATLGVAVSRAHLGNPSRVGIRRW
jgi:hypothetical protein